ncbi:unnamed protein product [Rhizopus stolonifer]
MEEWELVEESEVSRYLPSRTEAVKVKIGIAKTELVELPLFGFVKMEDHFKYKKGFLLNTGGNTWGLDFVPKLASQESDPFTQYLAVSGYKGASEEHMSLDEVQPTGTYHNCIQIWKMKLSAKQVQEDPIMDICILHDFGVIYDLKWCPYGAYEEESEQGLPKLGILTVACGDSTIRTFIVPHPDAIRSDLNVDTRTLYLRVKKCRATLVNKFSTALSIDWGGHQKLASTGTGGDVTLWDMQSALTRPSEVYGQFLIYSSMILDSPGKMICWHGKSKAALLLVSGLDGQVRVVDTNDPGVPFTMSRSRGPVCSVVWPGHAYMFLSAGSEDMLRATSASKSAANCHMKYSEIPGFVWGLGGSEHHGHISVANATGWNITTNAYQQKKKAVSLAMYTVFKLCYHEPTKTYTYVDGIGVKDTKYFTKVPRYELFSTPEVALQKTVWNPNKLTSGFLATAGSAGLCRVEFEGRGPGWQ